MRFTLCLLVLTLTPLAARGNNTVFDNNFLYGYRSFLFSKPFEKVIGLQDINTFYVVNRPIKLNLVDPNHSHLNYIILQEDTLIAILDKEGDRIRIGLTNDELSQFGKILSYTIFESQLWTSRLVKVGSPLALIDEINGQSVIVPMRVNHSELHENRKRRKGEKIILKCYARVKKFLLRHQLVDQYLPGVSAKMAKTHLEGHGFQQVIGPRSAPVGSVCVYSGGWHGHGHIEVKRGARCWWYGYGCKTKPVRSRKLIGCYHKGWGAQNFAIK